MADIGGRVEIHRGEDGIRTVKVIDSHIVRDSYPLKRGWKVLLQEDQETIESGDVIATRGEKQILADRGGRLVREVDSLAVVYDEREERDYEIPSAARLLVGEGQRIEAGGQITEGSKNPHTILSVLGREATQLYLVQEVQKVYRSQGVSIHDKHFEVIISKMLSRVQVIRSGDTELLPGDLVDRRIFAETNAQMVQEGGEPASARPVLLGVTKAALNTESFLSASSFQHTIKVLAGAAIEGKRDALKGLKENVIIGKLIPAGTGFWESRKEEMGEGLKLEEGLEGSLEAELSTDLELSAEGLDLDSDDLTDILGLDIMDVDEDADDELDEDADDELDEDSGDGDAADD
jgi:DNA-directed RNA polymerase subunit beta'